MKNLFLAAGMTLFAFSGMQAKDAKMTTNSTEKTVKVEKKLPLTKCYRKAVDPFGNIYYVEVPCPKVIILKATEDISPE